MNIPDEYFKEGGWMQPVDTTNDNIYINRIAFLVLQQNVERLTYFIDATISDEEIKKNKDTLEELKFIKIKNAKLILSNKADEFVDPFFYNFKSELWEKI